MKPITGLLGGIAGFEVYISEYIPMDCFLTVSRWPPGSPKRITLNAHLMLEGEDWLDYIKYVEAIAWRMGDCLRVGKEE